MLAASRGRSSGMTKSKTLRPTNSSDSARPTNFQVLREAKSVRPFKSVITTASGQASTRPRYSASPCRRAWSVCGPSAMVWRSPPPASRPASRRRSSSISALSFALVLCPSDMGVYPRCTDFPFLSAGTSPIVFYVGYVAYSPARSLKSPVLLRKRLAQTGENDTIQGLCPASRVENIEPTGGTRGERTMGHQGGLARSVRGLGALAWAGWCLAAAVPAEAERPSFYSDPFFQELQPVFGRGVNLGSALRRAAGGRLGRRSEGRVFRADQVGWLRFGAHPSAVVGARRRRPALPDRPEVSRSR